MENPSPSPSLMSYDPALNSSLACRSKAKRPDPPHTPRLDQTFSTSLTYKLQPLFLFTNTLQLLRKQRFPLQLSDHLKA